MPDSLPDSPNPAMHIHVDFQLPEPALDLLKSRTRDHHLSFARGGSASVLAPGQPDPALFEAEIIFGQPAPADLLQSSAVRLVQISSSGITRYDTPDFREAAARKGIQLCNSAHVFNRACADHLFAFLLAQSRQLPLALRTRSMEAGRDWVHLRNHCVPLDGQDLLILGFGAIGERLVELLRPYPLHITAYRRTPADRPDVRMIHRPADLQAALGKADHILNILPDSPHTRHFFDTARFQSCKPGAVFYNIGRGTTVDQSALLHALDHGPLSAAWLDVTDPEPLPDAHPLTRHPRVYLTPHIAGGHATESLTLVRHFLHNLQQFLIGAPLRDQVI